MKRITQIVALMVALLLAGQSALAKAPCMPWLASGDPAAACCISAAVSAEVQLSGACHGAMASDAMTSMYRMPQSMVAGCSQSGCEMVRAWPAAQVLTAEKSRVDQVSTSIAGTELALLLMPVQHGLLLMSVSADRLPRYLLYQVFRV